MIASLSAALQQLKEQLARQPEAVPMLSSEALEQEFHGLSISQVARLVDAPALAQAVTAGAGLEGASVRYLVDGADEARKAEVARRLLLDADAPQGQDAIREVTLLDRGLPRETLVRDRNDVVYRVGSESAVVDEALTEAVRATARHRAPAAAAPSGPAGYERPVTIADGARFAMLLGHVIRGLARLAEQQHTVANLRAQLEGPAGSGLPGAVLGLNHQILADLLLRLLDQADRSGKLLAELQQAVTALAALLQERRAPQVGMLH
jgi:hypothetical protein